MNLEQQAQFEAQKGRGWCEQGTWGKKEDEERVLTSGCTWEAVGDQMGFNCSDRAEVGSSSSAAVA